MTDRMNEQSAREILRVHSIEGHFNDIDLHGTATGYLQALEDERARAAELVKFTKTAEIMITDLLKNSKGPGVDNFQWLLERAKAALSLYKKGQGE